MKTDPNNRREIIVHPFSISAMLKWIIFNPDSTSVSPVSEQFEVPVSSPPAPTLSGLPNENLLMRAGAVKLF